MVKLFPRTFVVPVPKEEVVPPRTVYLSNLRQDGLDLLLKISIQSGYLLIRVVFLFIDEGVMYSPPFVFDHNSLVDKNIFDVFES